MKTRYILQTVTAGLLISAALPSTAVEFPDPANFNPTWESAKPGSPFSRALPTAALLGNGSLGVVNGGDGNAKKFVLTRGDLWSCGDLSWGYGENNIRPISFAEMNLGPGMHSIKSADTLDLPSATLVTEGGFGKGSAKFESYVASGEDVFVVTGVSTVDDIWNIHLAVHRQDPAFPRETKSGPDGFYVRRSTVNLLPKDDPRGWTTNATAAVSVLGAELSNFRMKEGVNAEASMKIHANKPFAILVCSDPGRRFTWEELAAIRSAHLAWWKEWWSRSRIAVGDELLERYYYGQVYLMGSCLRQGKFPAGLYGIWVTTDRSKWHNDFHLNYNYVGTYYGCFAANRCEVAETMPDPLVDYLPRAIVNAKSRLQGLAHVNHNKRFLKNTQEYLDRRKDLTDGIDDAALYPVALGPWGVPAEGDAAHWSQVSDGAFQCAVMCTHWEYTLDRAYLKKVWPVLDKTANFFLKWAEKEPTKDGGYRYSVYDSHWEGSGLEKNSAPCLGSVKHLFATLVDVAPVLREMGIEVPAEKLAAWKDFDAHLADLPVGEYPIDGKNVRMLSGVEKPDGSANPSGANALNLESVIPGEAFSFDITDEYRTLATNAVNGNIAKAGIPKVWSGINQTPKLFATAIRVGYPPQPVIDAFKTHQLGTMQKNFYVCDNVHGVEKIGAMEFIQSMLIQCDHGFVKVFPNWTGKDAKFENLRAKGCFTLSSEMKDGKVAYVRITSEKGGRIRLVDPFGGKVMPQGWTRGQTRNSREPTLERDFAPGESVVLTPECMKRVLVFSRCEGYKHKSSINSCKHEMSEEAKKGAFAVDFSDDYASLEIANLKKYDSLVLNNTTCLKTKENPHVAPAICSYVRGGGGLCVIHAGADNFYDAPECSHLIGGRFDGHPWVGRGTWAFKVEDRDSPITAPFRSFPDGKFKRSEEVYQQQSPFYDRSKLHVLISLDMADPATANAKGQKRADRDNAVSWIRSYGKGRVFYTTFGHDSRAWNAPDTRAHIFLGLDYTLGR